MTESLRKQAIEELQVVSDLIPDLVSLERELSEVWSDESRLSGRESCHEILTGRLWLGGCEVTTLPPATTHVISLCDQHIDPPTWDMEDSNRLVIKIQDSFDARIASHFNSTGQFLDNCLAAGGAAYVHCQLGRSRSASIVIAYLVRCGSCLLSAYAHVMLRRHISALNYGFMSELGDYEESCTGRARRCTLPLMDYFRIIDLHLCHIAQTRLRSAANDDIVACWSGKDGDNLTDGDKLLAKLVKGLRYVCVCMAQHGLSRQAWALLRQMEPMALPKVDPWDVCPCDSGAIYKKCCGK